jgi:hypothetical protein
VKTRRGIPRKPVRCIGRKAMLKPVNASQKAIFPSLSLSILPLISG